jgi:ATP-dependent RNA helicase DHX57
MNLKSIPPIQSLGPLNTFPGKQESYRGWLGIQTDHIMGKKDKKSSAAAKKAPKCTCEHLYKCDCGNRPERPSRGHKWDPIEQKWGGKGHKQKGGSGQTSLVATAAKTTEQGQTVLAQWQQLPSSLLADVCKKEKRPPPKFKNLVTHGGGFKFRVVIQDAKASKRGGAHDIILMPVSNVPNVEQAKEEAALLALLNLTPTLPHERKLPEPYKTTWINALKSQKEAKSKPDEKSERAPVKSDGHKKSKASSATSLTSGTNATASTASTSSNLMNANTYTSLSEKWKQKDEKSKTRKAKIRRHEAVRQANRDIQVFMSAQVRKQIESLLRGDADMELLNTLTTEDDADIDGDEGDEGDVVMIYVVQRLVHEGFSMSHAKAGFSAVLKNPSMSLKSNMNSDEDQYMDLFYDESLQWLCVHLNEDQLPEGFGECNDVICCPSIVNYFCQSKCIIETCHMPMQLLI